MLSKKTKRSPNSIKEALTLNNNSNSSSLDMEEIFRTVLKETSKSNVNTKSSNNDTTMSKPVSLSEEQRLNCEFIANIINKESLKLAETTTKNNNNLITSKKLSNKQKYDLVTSSSSLLKPLKKLINKEFLPSNVELKEQKTNLKLCNENNNKNKSVIYSNNNKNETNANNSNLIYNGITNNSNTVVNMQLAQSSNSMIQSSVSI